MFMQSAAMALAFGSFFQYGKRKISAMSNEEFNPLTPEELTANLMSSVNNMIPTVQQSFHQMEQMNVLIQDAMAKYFNQAVGKIEQWIQTGGRNLQQNIQTKLTDPITGAIEDFIDSGGQILPSAGAEDYIPINQQTTTNQPTYSPIETWLSKWINPQTGISQLKRMTQAEANYALQQMSKGNLNLFKQWRTQLIKHMDSFNVKPLTSSQQNVKIKQAIQTSTTAGSITQNIALFFSQVRDALNNYKKVMKSSTKTQAQRNASLKTFILVMKKYNVFVARNRKPNLQVDTAKSIKALRLVPKS